MIIYGVTDKMELKVNVLGLNLNNNNSIFFYKYAADIVMKWQSADSGALCFLHV